MKGLGAVVLAAGLSSRMHAYKPMLMVDGQTMIARVVSMMWEAGCDPVVVVTGYHHATLEEHLKDSGVRFVHNGRYRETQMLDSLLLGLEALDGRCGRILISPSDVPLVRPETAVALMEIEGQFVRPTYRGEPGHPVLLDASVIPILACYKGDGGLRGAVEAGGVTIRDLEVEDQGTVLDSDTEEEYTRLLSYRRE